MLFEYCAENFTNIEAALRAGAGRIELCDNLAQGGTTPSAGVIEQAVGIVHAHEDAEVFHMAFDELAPAEQLEAIDVLAGLGVDHILTHGGAAGAPIEDNFDQLRACIERAAGRLVILPGGGITHQNAARVAEALGVDELHGTKIVKLG